MRDTGGAVAGPAGVGSLPLSGLLWDTVDILHRPGVVRGPAALVVGPVVSLVLQVGGARAPARIVISLPLFSGIFLPIF